MALSLRKQPGRTFLVVLAGTSLVLFFLNQTDLRTPFAPHPAHLQAAGYSHRRIQDYSSPEYTAPGETGGLTAIGTAKDRNRLLKDGESKDTIALDPKARDQGPEISNVEEPSSYGRDEEIQERDAGGDKTLDEDPHPADEQFNDATKHEGSVDDPLKAEAIVGKEAEEPIPVDEKETVDGSTLNKGVRTPKPDLEGTKDEEENRNPVEPLEGKISWFHNVRPGTKQGLIDSLIDKQREVLAEAMQGYTFHRKLKASKMDDLVLEKGGRPVRSIVITTWRSGSTFIGDVLQSHPATYYHYEPLLDFDINQVRHGKMANDAIHNLRHLLTCNYTDMDHYLNYGPDHPWLFMHNRRLWYYCTSFPELCWNPDFLTPFCSLFPFQSLKTVRLRLNLTREFLQDKSLGVQVLLLVRDPRGTMQSRRHRDWCPGNPDCDDPAILCKDLVSDYNTAIDFRRKFPHSFKVIRYEDLSFDAYNMSKELFNFFHLSYHPRVKEFLDTHTKETIGGVSSTFRNSKTAPIHWQQDLTWEEVESIQRVCSKALKLWGYEIATDEKHLKSFMPVGTFKFR